MTALETYKDQLEKAIRTPAQAKETKHIEGQLFVCSCCKVPKPVGTSGGTGYAIWGEEILCYACADSRQRKELKGATSLVAYVASDEKTVTTWTGGELGKVTGKVECQLTRTSWVHGKSYWSYWVTDCHGQHWYGRSSPGIAIKLRRVKGGS